MAEVIDILAHGKSRAERYIWASRRQPVVAKALVVEAAICGWLEAQEAESWIVLQGWEAA